MIIDGEIVALDEKGRPSFNLLQNRQASDAPVFFYAFDLLAYRERSLAGLPLKTRRALRARALQGVSDPIRVSQILDAEPVELTAAAREQGLEGIVAKRLNSTYESGKRRGAWVKYRVTPGQELVIGGYKPGKDGFESLLVGYYERGKLMFLGKVRNGFVTAVKRRIFERFRKLGRDASPFANLPEPRNARRGEALTAEAMKKYCWLKPELVAQVEFTNWTAANHLRHARFVALRDDKKAREVVRDR